VHVDDRAVFGQLRRGDLLLGLEVDLAVVPVERFRELIERAWRHRAAKRLVAAYDTTTHRQSCSKTAAMRS